MILFFYVIDLVINLFFAGGFFYRYKQTSVVHYAHLGAALLAMVTADALLGFLVDNAGIILYTVNGAIILDMVAGLVIVYVVLNLIKIWIISMKHSAKPAANKLATSERVVGYLKLAYPALTLLSAAFWVMVMVTFYIGATLALLVGLAWTACVVLQLAICAWMYLDIQNVGNASQTAKRNQLIRLIALSFFGAWPALFAGVGVGYGVSICWWIWMGIALWPNALVGYEMMPQNTDVSVAEYNGSGMQPKYPNAPEQVYTKNPNQYSEV